MRRREFLLSLGVSSMAGCAQRFTRNKSPATDAVNQLEALLSELMKVSGVPGASIACVQEGQVIWSSALGVRNSSSKMPVESSTAFEAASVSKTVFSYAALKLCERGVLDLDTPLVHYTPNRFVEGDPRLE